MKKLSLLMSLIVTMLFAVNAHAQSSRIGLISYKQIEKVGGSWQKWPSSWTNYSDEGRTSPEIRISLLSTSPYYVYNLVYYIDGNAAADFEVVYDEDKTAQMRSEWNTQYVNCYVDGDGNYIYLEGTSLDHLAKDPNAWASNPNTKLYMWVHTDNFAVIVK